MRGIIWKGGDAGAGDLTFALFDGEAVDHKDVFDQGCELEDDNLSSHIQVYPG